MMSNSRMSELEKLADELIATITTTLTLQERSYLARTSTRMKTSVYQSLTLFTSPDTNKQLSHHQALGLHERYLELDNLLAEYPIEPSWFEKHVTSEELIEINFLMVMLVAMLTAIISSLIILLSYDHDIDTSEFQEITFQGFEIVITPILMRVIYLCSFNDLSLNFNTARNAFLFLFWGLAGAGYVIGAAPANFAYLCGTSKETAQLFSYASTALIALPYLTDNYALLLLNESYIFNSILGFGTGMSFSILTGFVYGLVQGDIWNSVGKALLAASLVCPTVCAVAGASKSLTDYRGLQFFKQRNEAKAELLDEKEEITSTLKI